MFITEEQLNSRLKNPRNLANRFGNLSKREVYDAEIVETENKIEQNKIPQSETLHKEGIQFRTIARPGNNRPWLSKSERTGIAADFASATCVFDKNDDKIETKTMTEIARAHNVQVSTVSDIVNGTRRVADSERSVDQAKVDLALDKVREVAIDKLMAGLGQLTEDKISVHNAKDISTICYNMAKVVQQTIPQEKGGQPINLIVYTPELRAEKNFDVVEVD